MDVHWIDMNHTREDKHRAYFGEALDLVEQFAIEDVISFHLDYDPLWPSSLLQFTYTLMRNGG